MLEFVQRVAVIGCGGIGSWLLGPLLRFLAAEDFKGEIKLWDGDRYSPANKLRQEFQAAALNQNKAEAQAENYRRQYPGLNLVSRNAYVAGNNVREAVRERTLIFVCVDNHPARVLVDQAAANLRNVCVLSAGNEKLDGNVCVTLRRAGKPLTASFLERHPEAVRMRRGDRSELSCEELAAAGDTQLLVTNFTAATAALAAFQALWAPVRKRLPPQEIYFDLRQCALNAVPAAAKEAKEATPCLKG
jgi:molybdopterin/thiamine biosynthesis adenylyltransferase